MTTSGSRITIWTAWYARLDKAPDRAFKPFYLKLPNFEMEIQRSLEFYNNQQHLMFTFGDDFNYQNANQNYKNMDKLIRHMNENSDTHGYHLLYSTPSCYVKALNDAGEVWSTKEDDFFPYASGTRNLPLFEDELFFLTIFVKISMPIGLATSHPGRPLNSMSVSQALCSQLTGKWRR